MAQGLSLLIVVQCLLSFLIHCIGATELVEIPPPSTTGLSRRDDYSSLNLKDEDIYLWGGGSSGTPLANFTVSVPADHENILSLERFGSLLSSITCTNTSIKLVFKDQNAFLYAQKEWNWVNVANHTFVIVAGAHQCGWNSYRLPFVVNGATYDNSTKTANLAAVVSEWKRVAHTCEMWVGQIPASSPAPSRFMPRDFAETLTVDFEHTLPANWSSWTFPLHIDNVTVTAECLDCGTHGSFVWQFHFSTVLFVPTGVSLTLQANGVGISVTPALHIEADLATQHDFPTVKLGTIPIDGLTIPGGILDLGPEIVVNAGGSFGPVSADATVSAGVELVLDSNPSLDIGLTSPSFHSSGSWIPKLQQIPFTIDAEVKGAAEIFLQFSAQFSLEALDQGFEIGLVLQPFAQAEFIFHETNAGACANDAEKRPFGIEISPTLGAILSGDAAEADDTQHPFFSDQIASTAFALPTVCFPFGPAQTTAK